MVLASNIKRGRQGVIFTISSDNLGYRQIFLGERGGGIGECEVYLVSFAHSTSS